MKSFLLFLFTLAINTIVVLSVETYASTTTAPMYNSIPQRNEIDTLLDGMINFQQIYDLHNDSEFPNKNIEQYLKDGFQFIVNSVSLSKLNNMTVPEIRDELFEKFGTRLEEIERINTNNSLGARDSCNWVDHLKCVIYEVGITACIGCGVAMPLTSPAILMCVGSLGAQATWCLSNCWE